MNQLKHKTNDSLPALNTTGNTSGEKAYNCANTLVQYTDMILPAQEKMEIGIDIFVYKKTLKENHA